MTPPWAHFWENDVEGAVGDVVDCVFIVSVKAVVCDSEPEVPATVIGYAPAGVDAEAETVKVELQFGTHDPAEKRPEAPEGRPETENETD